MILDDILSNKKQEVAERKQRIKPAEFRTRAETAPPPRDWASALDREQVALIAEIKRSSPSRGVLNDKVSLPRRASEYARSGAAALSVLTDKKYFNGNLNDLKSARVAVEIPILRKDFIVDEYQVYESRALQADAVLLIVRVLSDMQLRDYYALAHSLGMGALVEIHDEADLERALAADARVVGINNRNLSDFTVDLKVTERLASLIPARTGAGGTGSLWRRVEYLRTRTSSARRGPGRMPSS